LIAWSDWEVIVTAPESLLENDSTNGRNKRRRDNQVMADTGENRQISGRANAKEAETVRASKRMVSKERSTERETGAAFGIRSGRGKGLQRGTKGSKESSPKLRK